VHDEPRIAGVDRSRLDAQPDRGEEWIGRLAGCLDGRAGADGPFDADRRRLAESGLPFQRQGIGLSAAFIDAADLVDHTGGIEQPLGQARLTGVDMRQNPQVQRSHNASCPRDRRQFAPGRT
jgi:hypothetical protein